MINPNLRSFGCIIYELFKLEKLFLTRNQDVLRLSIANFDINRDLNTENIKPIFVRVLQK